MKKPGAHAATIDAATFLDYVEEIGRDVIAEMLKVKDKNLSAIKCAVLDAIGIPCLT